MKHLFDNLRSGVKKGYRQSRDTTGGISKKMVDADS